MAQKYAYLYYNISREKRVNGDCGKDSTFSDGSGQDPAQTKVQLKQNLFDPRANPTAKKGPVTWGTPKKRASIHPYLYVGDWGDTNKLPLFCAKPMILPIRPHRLDTVFSPPLLATVTIYEFLNPFTHYYQHQSAEPIQGHHHRFFWSIEHTF